MTLGFIQILFSTKEVNALRKKEFEGNAQFHSSLLFDVIECFSVEGYLIIGLWAMMLLMSVMYDIPELNIGFHFYMKSDKDDEEHTALNTAIQKAGPKYTKHVDEEQTTAAPVVPEESRGLDQ